MPKVFANHMVAHVWAQQNQDEGRSHNGNAHFAGNVFYSYSTPIAVIVRPGVALLTSKRYSATTEGKHKNAVRRALDCLVVPSIGVRGGRNRDGDRVNHKANVAYLLAEYETELARLAKKRDALEDWHAERLTTLANAVSQYREAFKLKGKPIDVPSFETLKAQQAERIAKASTPEAIAKRAKERARREAKEARIAADRVGAWRRGELRDLGRYTEAGGALLRVKGEELQTSLGAAVPLPHAIKAFRFIKLVRERGEPWQRNGHSVRVGHFQIDQIDTTGDIVAGCHKIHWPEIERAAIALGVFNEAPSTEAVEHS